MKSCDATKKIDREWLLNWLLKWLLKNPVQFFRCDFMHRLFHKPLEILELQRGLVETRGDSPQKVAEPLATIAITRFETHFNRVFWSRNMGQTVTILPQI